MKFKFGKPKKSKPEWQKQIESLADQTAMLEQKLNRKKEMYSKYLIQLEEIEDEKEAIKVQIQSIAREHAGVVGSTVRFVDTPHISVEVQSPRSSPTYSLKKARKFWEKDVMRQVLAIDSKLVEQLVASGDISEAVASKAAVSGAPLTPRVIVKLKGAKTRDEEA